MKTLFPATLTLAVFASINVAHASTDVSKASGCYSCHAKDEKVVGPSFKSIANKYASESDAVASLAQSIQNGSRGKWGRVPMPPHASLGGEDLRTLSRWVLTFKD